MNIYVGNLDFKVNENDLKNIFEEYGSVEQVKIIKDKYSGRSKGFGFVTFVNDEDGDKAIEALNDHELNGRKLAVNEARPKEPRD